MAPRSKDLGRATVVSLAAAAGAAEAVPGSVLTAFGATAPVCAVAASAPKKITDRTGFKRIVASVRLVFRGLKSLCRIEKPVNGLTAHVADLVSKAFLQSEVLGPGFLLLRRSSCYIISRKRSRATRIAPGARWGAGGWRSFVRNRPSRI